MGQTREGLSGWKGLGQVLLLVTKQMSRSTSIVPAARNWPTHRDCAAITSIEPWRRQIVAADRERPRRGTPRPSPSWVYSPDWGQWALWGARTLRLPSLIVPLLIRVNLAHKSALKKRPRHSVQSRGHQSFSPWGVGGGGLRPTLLVLCVRFAPARGTAAIRNCLGWLFLRQNNFLASACASQRNFCGYSNPKALEWGMRYDDPRCIHPPREYYAVQEAPR